MILSIKIVNNIEIVNTVSAYTIRHYTLLLDAKEALKDKVLKDVFMTKNTGRN